MDHIRPPRTTLRIAMVSNYLPSGSKIGVGYQVHELANAMVRRGHSVTVFSPCPPSDGARYKTSQISLPPRLRTFAFALALRRLDFSGFDVVHAHGDDYWLWRRRVPVHIRTMHGSCFAEAVHIRGAIGRLRMFLLGLSEILSTLVADRTVLVSTPTRRWYPWVKTVIPNGVDRQLFVPGDKAQTPTVLFVGTDGNRKRGWLVRRAFAEVVRPSMPDSRLVMVCEDAPAGDGVEVTGRLSTEDLAARYAEAWVFCLPSTYEGFGIPYAEAMAAGAVVVATKNAGAGYVTADGAYGCLCEDDELGDALLSLLSAPDRLASIRAAGIERASDFDLDRVCAAYESVYASRISRPGELSTRVRRVANFGATLPGAGRDLARRVRDGVSPVRRRARALAAPQGADSLAERISPCGMVQAGPFAGLLLSREARWGGARARLAGTYEKELAPTIDELVTERPEVVIDLGAAEGYYAAGLARRLSGSRIHAYEIEPGARRALRQTIRANGLVNVSVHGRATHAALRRFASPGSLVLCDVEGAEADLLDPHAVPELRRAFLVVELHEFAVRGVRDLIAARFDQSHSIELVRANVRRVEDGTHLLDRLTPEEVLKAVDEGRPQSPPMEWAVLRPRHV